MGCFHEKGLHFECQPGCRYCCGVEPGYVFVTEDDISRLSGHLKLSKNDFIRRYCRVPMGSISYISLVEMPNHDCVFLGPEGCTVYTARPVQCATYPFWSTVVADEQSWEEERRWCPGIGKGPLHTKEEIDKLLDMRAGVEPATDDGPM